MRAVALVALATACGAAPTSASPETAAPCRPATYVCSVLGAWSGVSARGRLQIDTGGAPTSGEIVGDAFRCTLELASLEPEHHVLRATCVAGEVEQTFELHEPAHAFRTIDALTLEPTCWYAQEGHARGDCDTCRAVDYCEGPDVD